jgi:hypothetical protein
MIESEYAKSIDGILGRMEALFINHGEEMRGADPELHARLVAANFLLSSAMPRTSKLDGFDGEVRD